MREQGQYKQTEQRLPKTFERWKTLPGLEHPSTLTSMNNRALVLSRQGKYEQAEEIRRQTLELQKGAVTRAS